MPGAPGSLLERARAKRDAARRARKPLELDVPGYGGTLVAVYGALEWEDAHPILTREEQGARATLEDNLDTVVKACQTLAFRAEDGELVALGDALREQGEDVLGEVRFDEAAVDALGLTIARPDAHLAVLAIFGDAHSPELSIALHAGAIGAWMHGASQEHDEELLGKS